MKKIYAIAGILVIVILLSTISVFAFMGNGFNMMGYRGNMMNSYYLSKVESNQNMMQRYSYESMNKMHDSVVVSIQDPELRNAMNKMHVSCIRNINSG